LRPASGHSLEKADPRIGVLALGPHQRTSVPQEVNSAPLRTLGLFDEKAASLVKAELLLIADKPTWMLEQLRKAFPAPNHRVQVTGLDQVELEQVRSDSPDVILLDLGCDQSEIELLQQIRGINSYIPIIVVTSSKDANVAIEATKHGAYDCLLKPFDLGLLLRVVGEALDVAQRLQQPGAPAETGMDMDAKDDDAEGAMIGGCPAMGEVYKAIGRIAAHDVPVLVTGESGTGKELVAQAIYKHSRRGQGPFLALNCAAIPENLLESELFGHEKGAFTGADRRRIGKFEQCHGGTLFLDEIGDMPPALQGKILRVLQEQSFERVGGNETIRTNVRIIAATHRDLKTWSEEGKFRADLYYRLGVFTIHLPPLRERSDDLPMLAHHFLRRFSRELGRTVSHINPEALAQLHRYHWPGNIRELQSVLKRALLHASGGVLLPAFLPESLGSRSQVSPPTQRTDAGLEEITRQPLGPNVRDLYAQTHRQVDRLLLPRVLRFTQGNLHQAAQLLGIARQTLRVKLRELGLSARPFGLAEEISG
jgi:two-component system nitrogen regulation response regulator GlnG